MGIEHVSQFITDLAMHFSPPRFDHETERTAWQKSIMRELHGATPEVIERAARRIIQTRKNRYFPLIADCRQAMREAAEEVRLEEHLETLPTMRQTLREDWSDERKEFALSLIKCGLGKQAVHDNPCWVLSLYEFCLRFQRLPDDRRYEARNAEERLEYAGCSELEFCKRAARHFLEGYEKCLNRGWPQAYELERLGDRMNAKRERLCAEVLGR